MSKSRKKYSDEEKLSLLREYHESGMSKNKFASTHGMCGTALLYKWLKKYECEKEVVPLQPESADEDMANRSKDSYKDENAQLKKRIKDLEKALEFSRLETLARDLMIDKAEEYFDISIRKKSAYRSICRIV